MKKATLKLLLVFAGAVLFNIIFWQEKMAINTLLFDAFILLSVFYLYPSAMAKPGVKWLLMLHACTLLSLIVNNTDLSKIAFCATLLLLVVFVQYLHHSVWYAAASAMGNYLLMGFSFNQNLRMIWQHGFKATGFNKILRLQFIPLLICTLFFIIYIASNSVLGDMVNSFDIALQQFIDRLFGQFNWQRFGFFFTGIITCAGLLLKMRSNFFSERELKKRNDMQRNKIGLQGWRQTVVYDMLILFRGQYANAVMALRNENSIGIISFVLLNTLLLLVNVLDVIYVWLGFKYNSYINLSIQVHEGAGMLIFSIVLAMMVLLFFFRGNLNFYKKNKWLRYGAYGWILQNALLVVSVFLRDYYYIQYMGLTYKRIGVLLFLLMVLFGLLTVFIKIHHRKTSYYLWRVNGWFALVLLVAASCVDWDQNIARYNIAHKDTVPLDIRFLLSLSDKTLPLIEQDKFVLNQNVPIPGNTEYYPYGPYLTPMQMFEKRKAVFFAKQKTYSWLSWNMADQFVKNNLTQHGKKTALVK